MQHRASRGPGKYRPGSRGPPRSFPPACLSCRFRSPGRCRPGAPSSRWFGLVPLLWAILSVPLTGPRHPLRRAFFIAYLCGVLWYVGNCYWIRDTMMHYGDMPPLAPELLHARLQPGARTLLRPLRPGARAGAARHGLHAHGPGLCAVSLDRPRSRRRAHHQRSLGPARLLAGGQRARQPARAVDRRLRHHFCSRRCECASRRRFAAGARRQESARRPLGLGRLRRDAADLGLCRRLCPSAQARSHGHRRPDSAQSRRGRRQQLARRGLGPPHRRIHAPGRRAMQDLHRRNPANRRAHRRNHLPAVSHSSRSRRLAGIACALL